MASKQEISFLLSDVAAEVDPSGNFNVSASYEVAGLEESKPKIVQFQIELLKKDKLVFSSEPEMSIVSSDDNMFFASAYTTLNGEALPDCMKLRTRMFEGHRMFSCEASLPGKMGSCSLTIPKTSLIGKSKWATKNLQVCSISVHNDDGDFTLSWTGKGTRDGKSACFVKTITPNDISNSQPMAVSSQFFGETDKWIEGADSVTLEFNVFDASKWNSTPASSLEIEVID